MSEITRIITGHGDCGRPGHQPAARGVDGVDLDHLFGQVHADANKNRHVTSERPIVVDHGQKFNLSLRPASEDDVQYLVSLRLTTMTEHLDRAGVALTPDEQEVRARSHLDSCSIVLLDQANIGMLKVLRCPPAWDIVQLQIEPDHQGKGIGSALIAQILSEASQVGAAVKLGVLKANPAMRLYERLGFKVIGEDTLEYEMRTEV